MQLTKDDLAPRLLVFLRFFETVCILFWTIALGGLGVAAFFATSLLTQGSRNETAPAGHAPAAPPTDDTPPASTAETRVSARLERLNDETYLRNRLTTGLIFGFMLGVCFSHDSIHLVFWYVTAGTGDTRAADASGGDINQAVKDTIVIMTPFLFGFSTDLALGYWIAAFRHWEHCSGSAPGDDRPLSRPAAR